MERPKKYRWEDEERQKEMDEFYGQQMEQYVGWLESDKARLLCSREATVVDLAASGDKDWVTLQYDDPDSVGPYPTVDLGVPQGRLVLRQKVSLAILKPSAEVEMPVLSLAPTDEGDGGEDDEA